MHVLYLDIFIMYNDRICTIYLLEVIVVDVLQKYDLVIYDYAKMANCFHLFC